MFGRTFTSSEAKYYIEGFAHRTAGASRQAGSMPSPNPESRRKKFVSEPIEPKPGSYDTNAMGAGEPGLPSVFTWRGRQYEVAQVLSTWKSHGEDRGDTYVRRHWYEILTSSGHRMRIYFDRNPGRSGSQLGRWWLYTFEDPQ